MPDEPVWPPSASSGVALSGAAPPPDTALGAAGASANAARADHAHPQALWTPADHGLVAWSYDPSLPAGNYVGNAGTLYLIRLHVPAASLVTNVALILAAAGAALTAGQCFAALYSAAGALIGVTADQSGNWVSVGNKIMALAGGPFNVAAGDVFVGFWWTGTTGPAVSRGNGTSAVNFGLAAASSRYATANTGLTTAAPANLGALTALGMGIWAGIS